MQNLSFAIRPSSVPSAGRRGSDGWRDYERLSETLTGLHYVAFSILMLHKAAPLFAWSS
jgi:hypothetical protein